MAMEFRCTDPVNLDEIKEVCMEAFMNCVKESSVNWGGKTSDQMEEDYEICEGSHESVYLCLLPCTNLPIYGDAKIMCVE